MRGFAWLTALAALALTAGGCELIVDFDRDRIEDGGRDVDAFVPDMDGGEEEDAGTDAGDDAGPDAGDEDAAVADAGMDDAGPDDAGTDGGPDPVCGNGTMEGDEACDDGNEVTETECDYGTASCTLCNADCSAELSLTGNVCGDGDVASGDEACDDGDTDTETECDYGTASCTLCNADCSAELSLTGRVCGDGTVDSGDGETCDDGNALACGTCSADCGTAITPAAATGTITAVAQSALATDDTDTFTISDGVDSVTFAFDTAGDGVTSGTAIDVSGDSTSADVAGSIRDAINADGTLDITAVITTTLDQVELTNDVDGVVGNVAITESVADSGFTVTGMSGGEAYDCTTGTGCTGAPVCSSRACTSDLCE